MAVSAAYKTLLAKAVWASGTSAQRRTPEAAGIDRADGWTEAYEQPGTGKTPSRTVWNQLIHEITAALHDLADYGVLPWDAEIDYTPPTGGHAYTTAGGNLYRTSQTTGPATGNATNPTTADQTVWDQF